MKGDIAMAGDLYLQEHFRKGRNTPRSLGSANLRSLCSQVSEKTPLHNLHEAAAYYLTPRGQQPDAPNKLLLTNLTAMVSFTGCDRADTLLTQPVIIIAGSEAGSLWHSKALYSVAPGEKKLT